MSTRPMYELGIRDWWRVRARTREWAIGQRVSLLDVPGIGRHVHRWLRNEGIELTDAFMAMPSSEIAERLYKYGQFSPKKRAAAIRQVEKWKAALVAQWRERVGSDPPATWRWAEMSAEDVQEQHWLDDFRD